MTPADNAPSRRRFLAAGAAAGAGALVGTAAGVGAERAGAIPGAPDRPDDAGVNGQRVVPFYGPHQAAVTARPGAFASFVALDLLRGIGRDRLAAWMRLITDDAARLTQGRAALADVEPELAATPAGLTVTVGFGRGFVERARGERPAWLQPLPPFSIDKLEDRWSGGDVLFIVSSDEPSTVAHALRMLLKDSRAFASVRWRQDGFRRAYGSDPSGRTMRNLFGQVDGSANLRPGTPDFDAAVLAGDDAPAWLRGGTSFVLRRIAMDLDGWDEVDRVGRENAVGRRLDTGAPLTGGRERDPVDLDAKGPGGLPVISSVAHARRARVEDPSLRIVRLAYNYEEPAPAASEALSSTGLLFGAWQADVDRQYVPIQRALDEADLLNVWTTPIGSAVFAIPPGCREGGYLGESSLGV
ncbi:Dyp-type peroxidase [Demequina sp.]|uniref:Dyp-type peroxidase n=1 Tax=Demequina sp. TaxID=2050685 RepID=UPI0025C0EB39|nr:Dyp-type peroxidase [Demequina sp.]